MVLCSGKEKYIFLVKMHFSFPECKTILKNGLASRERKVFFFAAHETNGGGVFLQKADEKVFPIKCLRRKIKITTFAQGFS